jgi:CHAD domain-containing protein
MSDDTPVLPADDVTADGVASGPVDPSGDAGSARAAIRSAIAASVGRLEAELPRARAGADPEGVHQARVATRRLRSDLRTFAPLVESAWQERIRAELAVLADALGAVRDADVLGMRLADAVEPAGVDGAGSAAIGALLEVRANESRRAMIGVIDDPRTETLLDDLRAAVADPPTTPPALDRADARLKPLVRKPWRKLSRAVAALGPEPTAPELHRVRLLAKRTRYAAEAVEPVFGHPARRFARAVTGVQEVLGDMNDAEVAISWLRDAVADLGPEGAFAAGRFTVHFEQVASRRRHGWEKSFERARKRSNWLRRAPIGR